MPVDTQHPDYARKRARWRKQRDAYAGEDAVKHQLVNLSTAGTNRGVAESIYLDRPEGFKDTHFARYIRRAKWYGATKRTIEGWNGAIFQKDPEIVGSSRFEAEQENITLTGISLKGFAKELVREKLLIGRYGVLVDYSEEDKRSYWSGYPTESIVNWKNETIGGKAVLTLLVLKEEVLIETEDEFEIRPSTQYKVHKLNEDGDYQIDTWSEVESNGSTRLMPVSSFNPTRRRRPIPFIPFQFFGINDLTPNVSQGPSDQLTDINFSYFRHSAEYEHALFLTASPTPVVTGHSGDGPVTIGSLVAWVFPEPDAKVYFLEYQGPGLESHERAMDNDKIEMATLGARLLEEAPEVAETLGAVQLRHAGDTGSLRAIANQASQGLTNLVQWHHWWNVETDQVNDPAYFMQLNTDLASARLSPQALQSLSMELNEGHISLPTYLWNLHQGEILPPGVTVEDEIRRIETTAPAQLPFGGNQPEENAA